MTNYQLIALLFPLGTAAACGLFGLGLVKWLNHKYPATAPIQDHPASAPSRPDFRDSVRQAKEAIQNAERVAHQSVQELAKHL